MLLSRDCTISNLLLNSVKCKGTNQTRPSRFVPEKTNCHHCLKHNALILLLVIQIYNLKVSCLCLKCFIVFSVTCFSRESVNIRCSSGQRGGVDQGAEERRSSPGLQSQRWHDCPPQSCTVQEPGYTHGKSSWKLWSSTSASHLLACVLMDVLTLESQFKSSYFKASLTTCMQRKQHQIWRLTHLRWAA